MERSMSENYVLIHGAWHGGWCWRRVADLLQAKGRKVYAPTLTGLGERSHLLTADVNLDTHIADIANVFHWEDLEDVCLVAHSYGGWPASGALETVRDRVSSIIWLDAFLPENGQRSFDFANPQSHAGTLAAIERGEIGRPAPSAAFFGVNERDRAWVDAMLTPQPVAVAMQPIKLTGARETIPLKIYIRAPSYPQPAFDAAYAKCQADPSWQTLQATVGHDVMVDAPDWLAEVLLTVS
jgi:pimeloyl-ACP methyl ester carboxylesterase